MAFPRFNLGAVYLPQEVHKQSGQTFNKLCEQLADAIDVQPMGYAVDKHYPEILYVPEDTRIDMELMQVSWQQHDQVRTIPLNAAQTYVYPSGFYVYL